MEVLALTPEEYLYHQTEDYALIQEQKETEWYKNYEAEEKKLMDQVNALLGEQTPDAWEKLSAIFQNPELHDIYGKRETLASVYILLNIYQYESYEEIAPSILEQGTSLEDFHVLLREIKFLLWRIQYFDIEHTTGSGYGNVRQETMDFLNYIKEHLISPIALYFFVTSICMDCQKMLLYLASQYMEYGNLYYTFQILKYYNTFYPDDKDVLYILSNLEKLSTLK